MFACVCICIWVCSPVCTCVEARSWLHVPSFALIVLLQGLTLNLEDAEETRHVVIKPLGSTSFHLLGIGLQVLATTF